MSEAASSSSQRGIQWIVIGIALVTPLIIILLMFRPVYSEPLAGDVQHTSQVDVLNIDAASDPILVEATYETEGRGPVTKTFEVPQKTYKMGHFTDTGMTVEYLAEDPMQSTLVVGVKFTAIRAVMIAVALGVIGAILWYLTRANY